MTGLLAVIWVCYLIKETYDGFHTKEYKILYVVFLIAILGPVLSSAFIYAVPWTAIILIPAMIAFYVMVIEAVMAANKESKIKELAKKKSLKYKGAYAEYTKSWIPYSEEMSNQISVHYRFMESSGKYRNCSEIIDKIRDGWRDGEADKLAYEHAKAEIVSKSDITCEDWIQKNKDIWVRYRYSILIPQFEILTSYWVPHISEFEHDILWERCSINNGPLNPLSVFEDAVRNQRKKMVENFSKQHAEEEYDKGVLMEISKSVFIDAEIKPPEVKNENKATELFIAEEELSIDAIEYYSKNKAML